MSTKGKIIKCRAALAWGPKKPLTVEEIEVHPPKKTEVRIKTVFLAICHTDLHGLDERADAAQYPTILGHESAGIVESVGDDVTSVKAGDHVIPVFIPHCGTCKFCKSGKTNWCDKKVVPWFHKMSDGTSRFYFKGKEVWHFMGTSSFSQYTVVEEIFVVKITPKAPLDVVCILGCGVPSGFGGAVNAAKVEAGSTCAIWGLGTIGLAAAMGCKFRGAKMIIGVDLNNEKEEIGRKFGITHFVNPKNLNKPIQEVIKEMTEGGCDYTFECIGNPLTQRAAFDSCNITWGKCVILGVAVGQMVQLPAPHFVPGKSVLGACFGGYVPKDGVPKLIEDYMEGRIQLKEFITDRKPLKDINEAFQMLYQGKGLRTVIDMQ